MTSPSPTETPATANPPSLILKLGLITDPIDLETIFAQPRPLEVELGSGDGSFLAQYAARNRDRNFLGVERLLGRLRKLDRKGLRAGLDNLRVVRIEAAYLLEFLLPPVSVSALHVYFPDPWPKRKHRKNRLINEQFTALAQRSLQPGGIVYLRTDDADYFQQMTAVFGANAAFTSIDTPADLSEIVTDFERQFNQQGIATNRAAYQLR
ncbi:MAG TPA: tRNA (guanosine(46)-N7)-methyltransferase TrmB [Verrucomicrobiae bacterium]|nr:tRNA (guanosine(46)-N7)-methyltransferase TrmB [Verrucomicrobiae bacterium]